MIRGVAGPSRSVDAALGTQVEFRLLGNIEVRAAGLRVDVGHARQRSVLAVLLLDVGRMVSAEQLIDRVWGEDPPASVRNVLYGYVARLRAALARAGDPEVALVRRPGGYLLQAEPDQVDLCRFRRLVAEVPSAADDQQAMALLRSALGLWQGTALAGVDSRWLRTMRDTLDRQRIAVVLELGNIALRQGQHGALISGLAEEAVSHPADERLIGQLMLALYRSGRPAEAAQWYEQTRRYLVDELGADPGPELQAVQQRILQGDPLLAGPAPAGSGTAPAGPGTAPAGSGTAPAGSGTAPAGSGTTPGATRTGCPVPRELPVDVAAFTGRAAELAKLDELLVTSGGQTGADPATAVISAVSGTAGVGKTALALHWAHRAAAHFPDGQLYVNLRGYDPGQPVTASDALAGFLRALGVAGQDIPAGEDERAARYRGLLAGRRILVLADNAGAVAQVRSLLPGSPGCVVVVTSRDSLAGLVARDGAQRLDLDLLPHEDAVRLLRVLIGVRAKADPEAVLVLAEQCARLPLALRVAAELAVARPDVPLTELTSELADQQSRLDLLAAGGDPRTAVRSVFSWSYQHLDPGAARAFRLLGLHPGPGFEPYATAALTNTSLEQARRLLDLLARAHLTQPAGPARYGMHDLLRAYAAEQAATYEGAGQLRAALTRLFDYYLYTAAIATDTLYPADSHWRPRIPPPATAVPPIAGPADARDWLAANLGTLAAVAVHTAEHGWPRHATGLSATMWRYLDYGGHNPEALVIHSRARLAAQQAGDTAAEAAAEHYLGLIDLHQGRYQQATGHLAEALELFQRSGDRTGQARTLNNLGMASYYLGRNKQASDWCQQALALHRENGDQAGETIVLGNLGLLDLRQGRYQQANGRLQRALSLARKTGNRVSESATLLILGEVSLRQGAYGRATEQLQQTLSLSREAGDRNHEASALARLGDVYLRLGSYEQAASHLEQALALAREAGDRDDEADALNGLGEVLFGTGRPGDARARHAAALGLASQIGVKYQQARAHNGMARACDALGDLGQARHHWQQALGLYTQLGAPEADQVRAQLGAAGDAPA
jgi:DNA-binding SARP family transcriptional activator/tetratricopeptide (TPR) repeat protein